VIADPRAPIAAASRLVALAELARLVAETPWALSRAHHAAWRAAGLADDDVLHAIALAAYFGHLNRIADAVAVPLDYTVRHLPPHADPTTPALAAAPGPIVGEPALALADRRATADALDAWIAHVFDRPSALDRVAIAARVAGLLGDGATVASLDPAIAALVDQITLAPWQLGDPSFAELRARGFDDAALFDIAMVASTAGVRSRTRVALIALGA
jgi:alkylhydroperoxidase family enzyme